MDDFGSWMIRFIVLGISLAVPVGPIKLEMIKRGLSRGFWHSWLVGLGAVTADFFFMFCIFIGLTPFLQLEIIQIIMLSIGTLMLLYLGTTTIKASFEKRALLVLDEAPPAQTPYWTGFLLALMNPLNFVFWFGIYGGTLQSLPDEFGHIATGFLSCFIIVGIVLWNVNVAFTVHFFRTLINETAVRWLMLFAGTGLLGFALHLGIKLINISMP
ncbi:LysE family transporter [Bacillus sp. NEB1478]|uniref:LysE family transporter n=1 Tax=Bacillus sp. NEB1478 TaxID=3073816 RepID=UPI0028738B41|nr:LysE family transporter [Bacillus sp. NEB1478]WNB90809.1 LysE family transporter [Bacillus sp. NEB1478]